MTPSKPVPQRQAAHAPPAPQEPQHAGPDRETVSVLGEQVALMRQNFPATLLVSLATALCALWAMSTVAHAHAVGVWMLIHAVVVLGIYGVLHAITRAENVARAACALESEAIFLNTAQGNGPADHAAIRAVDPCSGPSSRTTARLLTVCMAVMGLSWGALGYVALDSGNDQAMVYALAIISTVSSGALGLGAPLYRAYAVYIGCAMGVVVSAIVFAGGPLTGAALLLTSLYTLLTCLHARTTERATLRNIAHQQENNRLLAELRAQTLRAMQAQQTAERANRDKSHFLAAASHDLRQPLHALGLFLESLQRTPLSESQQVVLEHARAASDATTEMLTTLLDYSRLEAGVITVRPQAFAVQPLLTMLEQEFGVQADAAGLVYRTRETSAAAHADRALVGLVMHNFLSNALRYTRQGGVLIACRTRGKRLALEVWDTGPGIAQHQWDQIFEEFHQLGNPERDRRKGLGLGLAIVKRLAVEMNTAIELRSQPGRGSVFRLWLDCWQGALQEDDDLVPTTFEGLEHAKVLVIDDDDAARVSMHSLLNSWGCHCMTAQSGRDALQCLEDFTPDLIITDFRLRHEETGRHVLQALRAYLGTPVPGIILTGDTSPQRLRDAQSCAAVLLHKPVSTQQLRTAMQELLVPSSAVRPSEKSRTAISLEPAAH